MRVTSGQKYQQNSYCNTNPTSSGVQLECSKTKTPSRAFWFVASASRFSSHGKKLVHVLPLWPCAANNDNEEPCKIQSWPLYTLKSMITSTWLPFKWHWRRDTEILKYNVNLQQKYAKKKKRKEKKNKDMFWRGWAQLTCARVDRWDILFRLTRCWKKLPFFSERLASILPPHSRWENTNLRSANSGTVVLLWPPARTSCSAWSSKAWHLCHGPVCCQWLGDNCCRFIIERNSSTFENASIHFLQKVQREDWY